MGGGERESIHYPHKYETSATKQYVSIYRQKCFVKTLSLENTM